MSVQSYQPAKPLAPTPLRFQRTGSLSKSRNDISATTTPFDGACTPSSVALNLEDPYNITVTKSLSERLINLSSNIKTLIQSLEKHLCKSQEVQLEEWLKENDSNNIQVAILTHLLSVATLSLITEGEIWKNRSIQEIISELEST